jgi:integrase
MNIVPAIKKRASALKRSVPAPGQLRPQDFAYLRAVAEGLRVSDATARYLGVQHETAARGAHQDIVDKARALARRRHNPRWRLIGVEIRTPDGGARALPPLHDWAALQGLDGLRESELLELYMEAAAEADPDPSLRRRQDRAERLRRQQIELLRELEQSAAQPAQPEDGLDGWLPPKLVVQLHQADIQTLGDLQQRIERGGRWWRGLLDSFGPTKAARLAAHVASLLGGMVTSVERPRLVAPQQAPLDASVGRGALLPWRPESSAEAAVLSMSEANLASPDRHSLASAARALFEPTSMATPEQGRTSADRAAAVPLPAWVTGRNGANRALDRGTGAAVLTATDDLSAVREWIVARAGSALTATRYQREAERWMLWLVVERRKALSAATALDCRLYMDFLGAIPEYWLSRNHVSQRQRGWGAFRGPLSLSSQSYAVNVLHGLCEWLVAAGYLVGNPWVLTNRRVGDDPSTSFSRSGRRSRAFTPAAWAALMANLDASESTPSVQRLRWLLVFGEATGLRAAELLRAEVQHLESTPAGWLLEVWGKGRKSRSVPVPRVAMDATRTYLASRGLDFATAPPTTPLLASVLGRGEVCVTYGALYQSFTGFVRRALKASQLSQDERVQAAQAALHWLRHTHGTRAAERNVPPDVLQAGLGHADPRQTANYYRAQIERRQKAMEEAFKPSAN